MQTRLAQGPEATPSVTADRPFPLGRLARLWLLGRLQAEVAGVRLGGWVKHRLGPLEDRDRNARETRAAAARRLGAGAGRLRGATLEIGRILTLLDASGPVPDTGQFDVPPVGEDAVRDRVGIELGAAPEDLFAEFEWTPIAVGCFGQVHRARLATSEQVAVRVLYPGIERAVEADLDNLRALLVLGASGSRADVAALLEAARAALEGQVDCARAARHAEIAREALAYEEEIVVPRTFPELSGRGVLTTELLSGRRFDEWIAGAPPDARTRQAERVAVAVFRLLYSARLLHGDAGPREFLFLDDGRLALVGFGGSAAVEEGDWRFFVGALAARLAGGNALEDPASHRWPGDGGRRSAPWHLLDWTWRPLRDGGGQAVGAADLRDGRRALAAVLRRGFSRVHPVDVGLARMALGSRALWHRLGAQVDLAGIHRRELERAGLGPVLRDADPRRR